MYETKRQRLDIIFSRCKLYCNIKFINGIIYMWIVFWNLCAQPYYGVQSSAGFVVNYTCWNELYVLYMLKVIEYCCCGPYLCIYGVTGIITWTSNYTHSSCWIYPLILTFIIRNDGLIAGELGGADELFDMKVISSLLFDFTPTAVAQCMYHVTYTYVKILRIWLIVAWILRTWAPLTNMGNFNPSIDK